MRIAYVLYLVLIVVAGLLATFFPEVPQAKVGGPINSGDTAWLLTSSGLVLLMTPGLSFFYGGMVRQKNMLSTMLQSLVALGVVCDLGCLRIQSCLW